MYSQEQMNALVVLTILAVVAVEVFIAKKLWPLLRGWFFRRFFPDEAQMMMEFQRAREADARITELLREGERRSSRVFDL